MGMARTQEAETSRDWVELHLVRKQTSVLCASRRLGVCKTRLEDCKTTTTWSRPRQAKHWWKVFFAVPHDIRFCFSAGGSQALSHRQNTKKNVKAKATRSAGVISHDVCRLWILGGGGYPPPSGPNRRGEITRGVLIVQRRRGLTPLPPPSPVFPCVLVRLLFWFMFGCVLLCLPVCLLACALACLLVCQRASVFVCLFVSSPPSFLPSFLPSVPPSVIPSVISSFRCSFLLSVLPSFLFVLPFLLAGLIACLLVCLLVCSLVCLFVYLFVCLCVWSFVVAALLAYLLVCVVCFFVC